MRNFVSTCLLVVLVVFSTVLNYSRIGILNYEIDTENVRSSCNTFLSRVCQNRAMTDDDLKELYTEIASSTYGIYTIDIKCFENKPNPDPEGNSGVYYVEYQKDLGSDLYQDDRVQIDVYCTSYPVQMKLAQLFIGRIEPTRRLYRLSDRVR